MTTYAFVQKNTSATYTTSAESEQEAWELLEADLKTTAGWRLDETMPEDDDDDEELGGEG
jgi:hypothetical protein